MPTKQIDNIRYAHTTIGYVETEVQSKIKRLKISKQWREDMTFFSFGLQTRHIKRKIAGLSTLRTILNAYTEGNADINQTQRDIINAQNNESLKENETGALFDTAKELVNQYTTQRPPPTAAVGMGVETGGVVLLNMVIQRHLQLTIMLHRNTVDYDLNVRNRGFLQRMFRWMTTSEQDDNETYDDIASASINSYMVSFEHHSAKVICWQQDAIVHQIKTTIPQNEPYLNKIVIERRKKATRERESKESTELERQQEDHRTRPSTLFLARNRQSGVTETPANAVKNGML